MSGVQSDRGSPARVYRPYGSRQYTASRTCRTTYVHRVIVIGSRRGRRRNVRQACLNVISPPSDNGHSERTSILLNCKCPPRFRRMMHTEPYKGSHGSRSNRDTSDYVRDSSFCDTNRNKTQRDQLNSRCCPLFRNSGPFSVSQSPALVGVGTTSPGAGNRTPYAANRPPVTANANADDTAELHAARRTPPTESPPR